MIASAANRTGFVVETEMTHADGYGERSAAIAMLHAHDPGSTRRLTLGADKGYDDAGFVADLKTMCVTPHVAAKKRGSAIDGRTTRHPGYAVMRRTNRCDHRSLVFGQRPEIFDACAVDDAQDFDIVAGRIDAVKQGLGIPH